mmetsp:Transcript_50598/g.93537  ORF Transcript_50598/g.93537 Transcript_50598/m.93537 type:complete len:413 (-) Transcript_50598:304-1542(-)
MIFTQFFIENHIDTSRHHKHATYTETETEIIRVIRINKPEATVGDDESVDTSSPQEKKLHPLSGLRPTVVPSGHTSTSFSQSCAGVINVVVVVATPPLPCAGVVNIVVVVVTPSLSCAAVVNVVAVVVTPSMSCTAVVNVVVVVDGHGRKSQSLLGSRPTSVPSGHSFVSVRQSWGPGAEVVVATVVSEPDGPTSPQANCRGQDSFTPMFSQPASSRSLHACQLSSSMQGSVGLPQADGGGQGINSQLFSESRETKDPSGHSITSSVQPTASGSTSGQGGKAQSLQGSGTTKLPSSHSCTMAGQTSRHNTHGRNSQSFSGSRPTYVPSGHAIKSSVHPSGSGSTSGHGGNEQSPQGSGATKLPSSHSCTMSSHSTSLHSQGRNWQPFPGSRATYVPSGHIATSSVHANAASS